MNAFEIHRNKVAQFRRIPNQLKTARGFRQKGWLTIELGLALLVIAVLVAVAVLFYRDSQRKNSVNNNISEITFVASNANAKYGTTGRYGDVTTDIAVRGGVVPAHLRVPGTDEANNRFGGVVTIEPADLTGTNDVLEITWPAVPTNQCSDIVTGVQSEFRVITVAGAEVKANGALLDLAALEDACDADAPVDIVLSVGRF